MALRYAVDRKQYEVIELLLQDWQVNPRINDDLLMEATKLNDDDKMVRILLMDGRIYCETLFEQLIGAKVRCLLENITLNLLYDISMGINLFRLSDRYLCILIKRQFNFLLERGKMHPRQMQLLRDRRNRNFRGYTYASNSIDLLACHF